MVQATALSFTCAELRRETRTAAAHAHGGAALPDAARADAHVFCVGTPGSGHNNVLRRGRSPPSGETIRLDETMRDSTGLSRVTSGDLNSCP